MPADWSIMLNYYPEKKCRDHLGNEFPSKMAMCSFWNITPAVLDRRINYYGFSFKEALETPLRFNSNIICYDHNGKRYKSKSFMCRCFGIERRLYDYRISHGWSKEEALTKPSRVHKEKVSDADDKEISICEEADRLEEKS